jgi:hypothetical protein
MRLVSNRRLDLLRHLHNLLDSERRGKKLLPLQSDIAASALIVLFHALGLGSRGAWRTHAPAKEREPTQHTDDFGVAHMR